MKLVQIYAPTTEHNYEEIDIFYDNLSRAISNERIHLTCGDFNVKRGIKSDTSENALGNFETPGRNNLGDTHLNFLLEKNLYQVNS